MTKKQKLVREPQRKEITGVSKAGWYGLMAEGKAPRSIQITDRAVGWVESELYEWVDERIKNGRKAKYSTESDTPEWATNLVEARRTKAAKQNAAKAKRKSKVAKTKHKSKVES